MRECGTENLIMGYLITTTSTIMLKAGKRVDIVRGRELDLNLRAISCEWQAKVTVHKHLPSDSGSCQSAHFITGNILPKIWWEGGCISNDEGFHSGGRNLLHESTPELFKGILMDRAS